MIGWIILGSVVVVLIILLFVVRIGFIFKYDRVEGFEVTLKVAFIKILIYSSKRRKDAEEAAVEKPPGDKEEKEAGKEEGGFFEPSATRLSWPFGFRPAVLRHRLSAVLPFRVP